MDFKQNSDINSFLKNLTAICRENCRQTGGEQEDHYVNSADERL